MRSSTTSSSSSREREAASARWTSFSIFSRPADSRSAAASSSEAERSTIVSDELVLKLSSAWAGEARASKPSTVITVSESLTRSPGAHPRRRRPAAARSGAWCSASPGPRPSSRRPRGRTARAAGRGSGRRGRGRPSRSARPTSESLSQTWSKGSPIGGVTRRRSGVGLIRRGADHGRIVARRRLGLSVVVSGPKRRPGRDQPDPTRGRSRWPLLLPLATAAGRGGRPRRPVPRDRRTHPRPRPRGRGRLAASSSTSPPGSATG